MKKCKVCGDKTECHFNINFKATPICEGCATSIFLQQAKWYADQSYPQPKNNDTNSQILQNDIIAEQARKIVMLIQENDDLKDSEYRRKEWLRQAKKEAGYPTDVSFDDVWKETLKKAQLIKKQ